jgi:hypothetical protein
MALGFSASRFFNSTPLPTSRGGWPLPVKMIFDQWAFSWAGDLPA